MRDQAKKNGRGERRAEGVVNCHAGDDLDVVTTIGFAADSNSLLKIVIVIAIVFEFWRGTGRALAVVKVIPGGEHLR
jgi:hypothetical protein